MSKLHLAADFANVRVDGADMANFAAGRKALTISELFGKGTCSCTLPGSAMQGNPDVRDSSPLPITVPSVPRILLFKRRSHVISYIRTLEYTRQTEKRAVSLLSSIRLYAAFST